MKFNLRTIGSDPEFFLKGKENGIFVPSSLITNGDKMFPEETFEEGYLIHRDNLSIEGNIPPADNIVEFIANMKMLKSIISEMASTRNLELISEDVAYFEDKYLKTEDAQEFECSSFVDSWSGKSVRTPKLHKKDFRTGGFHIHLGYDYELYNDELYVKEEVDMIIGRLFDIFVTLPSDEIHYCKERRDTGYGAYGAIRHTSYGVECRQLGSFFTKDEYLRWVCDKVLEMFEWANSNQDKVKEIASLVLTEVNMKTITELKKNVLIKSKEIVNG